MRQTDPLGVIFDLDGVIVDSTAQHYQAFVQLGDEVGHPVTREAFLAIFGRRNADALPQLFGRAMSAEEIARLDARKEAITRDLLRGQVEALPGVDTLLRALHDARCRLAIGSSTPRANLKLILAELGVRALFDAIVSAEDVTEGKPNPQVFLKAAVALGIAPACCVVVEDAPAGVEAARRGGMKALAVTTNHPRAVLAHADRVVDHLTEVGVADFRALISP